MWSGLLGDPSLILLQQLERRKVVYLIYRSRRFVVAMTKILFSVRSFDQAKQLCSSRIPSF